MIPPIEKLLQPQDGNYIWQELANCYGDDRFVGRRDDTLTEELTDICLGCEVFLDCAEKFARSASAVFAAGEWRE